MKTLDKSVASINVHNLHRVCILMNFHYLAAYGAHTTAKCVFNRVIIFPS